MEIHLESVHVRGSNFAVTSADGFLEAQHGRDAGTVDVHIQQADAAAGHHQRDREVDRDRALADPALARQHHDFVPDAAEPGFEFLSVHEVRVAFIRAALGCRA